MLLLLVKIVIVLVILISENYCSRLHSCYEHRLQSCPYDDEVRNYSHRSCLVSFVVSLLTVSLSCCPYY